MGEAVPNSPPDTQVVSTPPSLERTTFQIEMYWNGTDDDGHVVGFEWRMSDNGRDGVVDAADTLSSVLPWHFTTAGDSSFVVSADLDSFHIDVDDPDVDADDVRFWQTHTFFVRAIDDDGARDPTPASVSFTATTLAPRISIDVPLFKPHVTCQASARALTFGWQGRDPDGGAEDPLWVRTLLIPYQTPQGGCYTQIQYEADMPIHGDDPRWSDWRRYDAPEGRFVTYEREDPGRRLLFAVQARDVAGAVTPVFEWGRNVRYVETTSGKFPLLTVHNNLLDDAQFVAGPHARTIRSIEGQTVRFDWSADASEYAGVIDAYRYGWNVADLSDPDDPGWAVAWGSGPQWLRTGNRVLTPGTFNLVIECRDNSTSVTRVIYQFQVAPHLARDEQRNVLLVDDYPTGNTTDQILLEQLWDLRWSQLLEGRVIGFTQGDVVDTQTDPSLLTLDTLSRYKSVIWFTGPSRLSLLRTEFAPRPDEVQFNWLESYQASLGNILLCGAGSMLNPVENAEEFGGWLFPLIFDVNAGERLGFDVGTRPDGSKYNIGTTRWPYVGWCLESVDTVRPPLPSIFGETPGPGLKRSVACDGMAKAEVAQSFLAAYPSATGKVSTLEPAAERRDLDQAYAPQSEEFYDVNVTTRPTVLNLRPCQQPMFRLTTRRKSGMAPASCPPLGSQVSTIEGVPVAVVSTAYSAGKPLSGSEDFLWGFHPLSFDFGAVQRAILWIIEDRWQIPVGE